jgi:hypothetical protein
MVFTVEPTGENIIDLTETSKDAKHLGVKYNEKFASGVVEKIIVFDPRKDIILQVNANGKIWTLRTTSHAGSGNTDILDAAVPWITLKSAITADFHSGSGLINRGVLAVEISFADGTGIEIFAEQQSLDERGV